MKLWQKNYLVTAALFTAVLFICVAVLIVPAIRSKLNGAREFSLNEEKAIAGVIDSSVASDRNAAASARGASATQSLILGIARQYSQKDTYLWIRYDDGSEPVNLFPAGVAAKEGTLHWQIAHKAVYITIGDRLTDGTFFGYAHDATLAVREACMQVVFAIVVCLGLCVLVNSALYITMLGITKPLSLLSHELRTPLTVIRGYGELLQLADLDPKQRHDAASYIVSESDRLRSITQKLLVMNDRSGITRERIPLEQLRQHTELAWQDVRIETQGDSIMGDRALLISLLDNLIGNAVKAEGRPITVSLSPDCFVVSDSGKGMDAETLRYVNDPDKAAAPNGMSGGLGIPLCHEIARKHRAKLTFRSLPGKGTTATVRFYNSETTL